MKYACILLLTAFLAFGAQPAPADEPKSWLEESMAYAKALTALETSFKLVSVIEQADKREELSGKLMLRGDSDMFFELGEDTPQLAVYTQGSDTTLNTPDTDRILRLKGDRTDMLKQMGNQTSNLVFAWLADYLNANPRITNDIKSAEFIAQVEVDNRPANHILLKYPNYNIEAWIAQDGAPTLLQLAMSFDAAPNLPKITLDMGDIKANHDIADTAFSFVPGDGTEVVSNARDLFGPKQNVKVGMKAPAFTLPKLGGGTVSLADHQGKEVVLLDFFASWCGPCRMAMPAIDALAEEYGSKGVAFYAVNLREGESVAQKFIQSNKINSMDVLLDNDGKISTAYEAFNIPRTVIVGKDGTVQSIHRGYSPHLKEQLKKDLDQILAGNTPE